jgi:hypothetical protein
MPFHQIVIDDSLMVLVEMKCDKIIFSNIMGTIFTLELSLINRIKLSPFELILEKDDYDINLHISLFDS